MEDREVSIGISGFRDSYSGLNLKQLDKLTGWNIFVAGRKQTTTECQECKELTGPTTPRFNHKDLPALVIYTSTLKTPCFRFLFSQDVSLQDAEGCRPPHAHGQGWKNGDNKIMMVLNFWILTKNLAAKQWDSEDARHEPCLSEASCCPSGFFFICI